MSTRCTYATLKVLLAHSFGDVTGTYVHVPFEELKKAVDSLPRLLKGSEAGGVESVG